MNEENFDARAWKLAKHESLPQLILKVGRLLDERAVQRMKRAGWAELTPAHTRLLPHVDLEGTRVTELAQRLGVTKQAVSQLVRDMERMGALERVPDPSDGRAKLVKFADPDSLFVGLGVLDELGDEAFVDATDEELTVVRRVLKGALTRLEPDDS
ncbi:MAG: MarR family winged helix-turn-helix transcriptional regulator [Myxococcota bacterium]